MKLSFVVDSGMDVRLVDGLASRVTLRILARRVIGGREISQSPRHQVPIEIGPAGRLAFIVFAVRRIAALRRDTDVVIVQGYGPTALCINVIGRMLRLPVLMLVCSPSEMYYLCRSRKGSGRPYRALEYLCIRVCGWLNAKVGSAYVALSPYLRSVIREYRTSRPIDVIPVYGVDRRIFQPTGEPKTAIRRRLGLPLEQRILIYSSRVAPEKDVDTVLQALAVLARRGLSVRLLHLSGGHDELKQRATAMGVDEHVIAGDAVAPFNLLADYYRASDVCVQASHAEGLGFSPLEALACGVPVVATAVGGLRDTIREGDTGWQVPPRDPEALASAVQNILRDPAEASRRTGRGAQEVDLRYEADTVFDLFLDRVAVLTTARNAVVAATAHPGSRS